jgi:hypothetical protein
VKMGQVIEMLIRSVIAKKNGEEVGHAGGIMQGWLGDIVQWTYQHVVEPVIEYNLENGLI